MSTAANSDLADTLAVAAFLGLFGVLLVLSALEASTIGEVLPSATMFAAVVLAVVGWWAVDGLEVDGPGPLETDGPAPLEPAEWVALVLAILLVVLGSVYVAVGWRAHVSWGYPAAVVLLALYGFSGVIGRAMGS